LFALNTSETFTDKSDYHDEKGTDYRNSMADQRPRVLVVDDDLRLRDLLSHYLTEQGFAVLTVADAVAMDRALGREQFDLLVLDLTLPGEDGLSVCRRLRGTNHSLPIVILTAKGDDVDRIVGLEIGADDYLPKPFNPRELVARMHAILRRGARPVPGAPSTVEDVVQFGRFRLELATRRLFNDQQVIVLTTGEFAMLHALVTHPRQTLAREKLMEIARGQDHSADDRSVDVQISRLRRLIEDNPRQPRYIQTVRGHGYVFVPDGTA
jgi:two-component system phosphate regulon response regulator OmpR